MSCNNKLKHAIKQIQRLGGNANPIDVDFDNKDFIEQTRNVLASLIQMSNSDFRTFSYAAIATMAAKTLLFISSPSYEIYTLCMATLPLIVSEENKILRGLDYRLQSEQETMEDIENSGKWIFPSESKEQGYFRRLESKKELLRLQTDVDYFREELFKTRPGLANNKSRDVFFIKDGDDYYKFDINEVSFRLGNGYDIGKNNGINAIDAGVFGFGLGGFAHKIKMDHENFMENVVTFDEYSESTRVYKRSQND